MSSRISLSSNHDVRILNTSISSPAIFLLSFAWRRNPSNGSSGSNSKISSIVDDSTTTSSNAVVILSSRGTSHEGVASSFQFPPTDDSSSSSRTSLASQSSCYEDLSPPHESDISSLIIPCNKQTPEPKFVGPSFEFFVLWFAAFKSFDVQEGFHPKLTHRLYCCQDRVIIRQSLVVMLTRGSCPLKRQDWQYFEGRRGNYYYDSMTLQYDHQTITQVNEIM